MEQSAFFLPVSMTAHLHDSYLHPSRPPPIPPPHHLNHALQRCTFMFVHIQNHTFLRLELRQGASRGWCTLSSIAQVEIRGSGESLDRAHTHTHLAMQIRTHTVCQHRLHCNSCYILTGETFFFPIWCYQSAALPSTHFLPKQNNSPGSSFQS